MASTAPVFTSLGMFIIDEIHFLEGPPARDIVGGAGTYGAVGARMFLPPPQSRRVGWFVDKGSDFPVSVGKLIDEWETGVVIRHDASRKTTRGWNKYLDNEERQFKYLAPKLRITGEDVLAHPPLASSLAFHLICSPSRCIDLTNQLKSSPHYNPASLIIWEPVPDECTPANWPTCLSLLQSGCVSVLSPNAKEAAMFFADDEPLSKLDVEKLASRILTAVNRPLALVLRCGPLGCVVSTEPHKHQWFPAYHNKSNSDYKLVDPTGGGNTFIGGFATGYVLSGGDLAEAAVHGNVAAGLAIEQIGVPVMGHNSLGQETWNGHLISDRIEKYRSRLA